MKIRRKLAGSLAIGVAAAVLSVPATANASDVEAQGCQAASATLHYYYYTTDGAIGDWTKNCSGTYSLNSRGFQLWTAGWAGYVQHDGGTRTYFCDWQHKNLVSEPKVTGMYLAETRPSWC